MAAATLESPALEIRLLGEPMVLRGGAPCPLPSSKKTRALLGYLVASGRSHTRERLCELFWEGPDDPNVCVLRVVPATAELWDGPASSAVAAYEFAKARLTGEKPKLGENRKVSVEM